MTDAEILWKRLADINAQIQWIADEESRSAWVNGFAARGGLIPKKLALIDKAEEILTLLAASDDA